MAATLFLVGISRKCSDNITVDGAPVWVCRVVPLRLLASAFTDVDCFYSTIELAHQALDLNRTELKRYRRNCPKQRENLPTSAMAVVMESAGSGHFVHL